MAGIANVFLLEAIGHEVSTFGFWGVLSEKLLVITNADVIVVVVDGVVRG